MPIFDQGDIIEVNFSPSIGHEPARRRPALVVSADAFNLRSSMTFVAPITSTNNGYPLHVPVRTEDADLHGYVCVEQTRAMDLSARPCEKVGEISVDDMNEVLNLLGSVFGI